MTRRISVFFIIVATFVVDRLTKNYFQYAPRLSREAGFSFSWLLDVTRHQNYGLIANTPMPQWIIVTFTSIVIGAIGWGLFRDLSRERGVMNHAPTSFALALILAGALGNLYDRLTMGYVFDWILLFQRSVINVADISIALGIIWWLILMGRRKTDT